MHNHSLSKFNKIISRFKKARVLVIGDIMLDRFIWGTVSRISPEAPVPVVWSKSESFMPGGAANVANNIRVLGAKAYMCGVVGDDEEGRAIISELVKNKIDSKGIVVDKTRPTVNKTRIIAHHQQVVRIDKESDDLVSYSIVKKILKFARERIDDIDAIIIEDYGKGLIVPQLIKELISIAKKHKKIIMVDPKENHLNFYKGITAMTPNRKEAEITSGIVIKNENSLKKAGRKLLQHLRAEAVLVTLGEDGMALFRKKGDFVHIHTVAQEVYDVSGAGDTVIATFALSKASGADMVEAAHISNIAAGIVVGKLGIATCNAKELESHLSQIYKYGPKRKKVTYPSDSIFKDHKRSR
ncbi:MAG: D-glycero-beta-D-manno-heptose-7-phosphate kinase [Candidatus Omnitrophica bacterium]|nr:D-glycero-beta-D-manno-heptose-7-phosphate kinase [Candidatus Omnitrophota bacterium]